MTRTALVISNFSLLLGSATWVGWNTLTGYSSAEILGDLVSVVTERDLPAEEKQDRYVFGKGAFYKLTTVYV